MHGITGDLLGESQGTVSRKRCGERSLGKPIESEGRQDQEQSYRSDPLANIYDRCARTSLLRFGRPEQWIACTTESRDTASKTLAPT